MEIEAKRESEKKQKRKEKIGGVSEPRRVLFYTTHHFTRKKTCDDFNEIKKNIDWSLEE
jgi:hypothetical protein